MICPHCNSPSLDGKKFCADCGMPLDPQMVHLATLVKSQVDQTIKDSLKDQKVLDIETTQNIVERVMKWAKMFGFIVALPLGILLLIAGIFGFRKVSDIQRVVHDVEQKVGHANADAEQAQKTAADAKSQADSSKQTIRTATADALQQLSSATTLEKQTAQQIQGSKQSIDTRMAELGGKIDTATREIAEQETKLASTDELVKTLFSKGTTEMFITSGTAPNIVVVPNAHGALVFMLLRSAPIFQTVEMKWHVASQPRSSYAITNNLLSFSWGDPAESLKQYPFEVTYVPDPTVKVPPFKSVVIRDNAVFVDDTKMMDMPPKQ